MNPKIRRRALRNFAASLLLSEMNAAEMRQLADELSAGNLTLELGELIRDMAELAAIDNLKKEIEQNRNPSEQNIISQNSRLRLALNAINRRRLSKKAIWEIMRSVSPEYDTEHISGDATVKQHVARYFATVSANDIARFLNLLEGDPIDAYLKGISKRG